jgi:hypothetical protein
MIDDIKITAGVLLLIVIWICSTIYAVKVKDGSIYLFTTVITAVYGLIRMIPPS